MPPHNRSVYQKIQLPVKIKKPVLAFGSQTKNTICFAKGNLAYLSLVHPDLNTPQDFLNFEKRIKYLLKKNPQVIACDLHPEYQSSKYAQNLRPNTKHLIPIQHHHAHIASCMADNGLKNQKVIGVAFDGTGLGSDGRLWGAEFLVCDYKNFNRRAHLREIPLLGGERAILEPWRLAVAWLYLIYKNEFLKLGVNFVQRIDRNKWQVLKNMYLSGFNVPLTSSMGRLFDAVASLVLGKFGVNFEAELAIELEKLAVSFRQGFWRKLTAAGYNFRIVQDKSGYIIDPQLMFKEIVADLKSAQPKVKIAYRFHLTVARMINSVCLILRRDTRINQVVLSGGVFQNNLLLRLTLDLLYNNRFKVVTHKNIPCNDAGISLGEALIAGF